MRFGHVRLSRYCKVLYVQAESGAAVEVRLGKSSRGCVRLCEVRFGKAVQVR